ncbi:Glutathione S-transferase U7 [Vitis vinifera]|uniref:Glutathione S-transferase n=1 Tax=Vitis vinifera TaxID=29760 RepID=A0A438G1U1_VITVI|nr:Glutathione S-transferase U7 [Vitis vinifera]
MAATSLQAATMAEELKLFGTWASPFSRRIEVALKLKGVQFDRLRAEPLVIMEYIDETWKHNPILPTDPYEKAMALFWAKYIDDKQKKVVVSKGEEQKGVIEEIQEQLKTLESALKETKFFGGRVWDL